MTQTDTIFQSTSPSYRKNTSADPDGSSPRKLHNMHNKHSKKAEMELPSHPADSNSSNDSPMSSSPFSSIEQPNPEVRKFIISPQADGIKITCTKKVTQFILYPTNTAPKVVCSPQKKEPKDTIACSSHTSQNLIGTSASIITSPPTPPIPHPSDLQCPAFNTYIKWHNVKVRIDHVSSACQSKHPMWQAALLKYTQNFDNGTIEARPFPGGPFNKCQHPAPWRRVVIDY
ncbi:hypothetical protein L208DRAFT_1381413 [Tricholoma matsutake]|nr:hypothetical protein L208DRAFT_1381413 [Tricholoma matsutake 945]